MPSVEATVIARLLIDEIISRHGAPRVLLSDRGTNFLSKVVAEVCKIFQIQKVNTSSYYPETDGLVERFNSTLCQSLSMYISKNQKDWDKFIPLILSAHRTSVLDATRRYGASVHFGVVVVELINCKCGGIVRNQIW